MAKKSKNEKSNTNIAAGVTVVGFLWAASYGWAGVAVAAIVLLIVWVLWSTFWPFADCRKCEGMGRFKSPTGGSSRRCPRCGGTGTRLMMGRKIWNKFRGEAGKAGR